jgi:putative phage-type endonuclease
MSAAESIKPNTPEWYEARRKYLGASDAPAALGFSEWKSPVDVWREKTAGIEQRGQTKAQRRGHVLEEAVGLAYSFRDGAPIMPGGFAVSEEHPWMAATPDFFLEGNRILQVKTANAFTRADWGEDGEGADGIPRPYLIQVHHEMIVTGAEGAVLVVLLADEKVFDVLVKMKDGGVSSEYLADVIANDLDLRAYDVERDPGLEDKLVERERQWWEEHVVGGVEPEDLRYLQESDNLRKAEGDELVLMERCKLAWVRAETASAELESLKAEVQAAISEDAGIICPSDPKQKITWKLPKPRKTTDWKAIAQHLLEGETDEQAKALIEEHTTEKPGSRRFLWPTAWKGLL